MMRELLALLEARADAGRPIRVAIAGAGRFGTSVAAQISMIDGLALTAVADPNEENGAEALVAAGWSMDQWRRTDSATEARMLIESGSAVLTPEMTVLELAPIDVLVEATGVPEVAAQNAYSALRLGRHVVMVTVEADVTCGWVLASEARRQQVVYTLAAGDQPIAIIELYDWAKTLGLSPVAIGRGTHRLATDRHGDPAEAFERLGYTKNLVTARRLNAQMYNSFRDGTKAQIEMCAVSNMTGLPSDCRGMHEPPAGLDELPELFTSLGAGGLLKRTGVVDLANAVAPDTAAEMPASIATGVWAVVTSDNKLTREDLAFHGTRVSSDRERILLFREYHLCGVETPLSIAQAALFGTASGRPLETATSEVIACAKRDLQQGDTLDGSGGRLVYGLIDHSRTLRENNLLPLGLSYGATVREPIAADEPIPAQSVAIASDSLIAKLRSNN